MGGLMETTNGFRRLVEAMTSLVEAMTSLVRAAEAIAQFEASMTPQQLRRFRRRLRWYGRWLPIKVQFIVFSRRVRAALSWPGRE